MNWIRFGMPRICYKAGSGFKAEAARQAGKLQEGKNRSWRFTSGSDFTKEITDLYKSMYRSGITVQRDARGQMIGFTGSDKALIRANDRLFQLAERMVNNVEQYDPGAALDYANMRRVWAKPIYVNRNDMKELQDSMRSGEKLIINPRIRHEHGYRSQDAANRAAEFGWQTEHITNAGILSEANRQLNAARNAIWTNVSGNKGLANEYTNELAEQLINRYAKTERAASTRRKS